MDNVICVAVKAIIQRSGKVLIIRRSKAAETDADTWEFPGGKLEFGEELEAALKREIQGRNRAGRRRWRVALRGHIQNP